MHSITEIIYTDYSSSYVFPFCCPTHFTAKCNGTNWPIQEAIAHLHHYDGDKLIGCAALSAAFINGIMAFGMDSTHSLPLLMPVLKLSYSEVISAAKIKILKAIDSIGGTIDSLDQLEQVSGYGKPLLSYHVQGAKDSKGLADLGLVEVEKGDRGKISAKLTTLGKLLVASNVISSPRI